MPSSKLSSLCEKIIEVGWLAALIVTPLFCNLESRRGFEADKLLLLRSLATVMAAAWLIAQLESRRTLRGMSIHSLRSALVLPTIVFIAAYGASTLLSIAPRISLLGSYTRVQGAYTTLAYLVIFAVIAQTLRTRRQLDRLIVTTILASVPVALYAFVQSNGMDPLFGETFSANRVFATFGNPIYLAAYLGLVFFLTLAKIFQSLPWGCSMVTVQPRVIASGAKPPAGRPNRDLGIASSQTTLLAMTPERLRSMNGRPANWLLFVAYSGIALLQGAALVFAGSRGPFLGWLAGAALFAVLFALICRRKNIARGLIAIGGVGIVLALVVALPNSPLANLRGVSSASRLLDLTSNPGDSADARLLIWQGAAILMSPHAPIQFADGTPDALNAIRPLVGYGPETLYLVFARYIPLELIAQTGYGGDTLVGRSHNETWDTLVNGGVLGLLANQILFCGFILVGLRALNLITTNRERNWFIALWSGLGGGAGIVALAIAPEYLGIAIPAGTLLALAIYLTWCAWRADAPANPAHDADKMVLAALVAGIVAHYVEIQFSFGVAASNLLMWVFAGLLVAVGFRALADDAPTTWLSDVVSYGALAGLMLVILASEFVTNRAQTLKVLTIVENSFTPAVVALFLLTWGIALIIVFAELARGGLKSRREIFFGGVLFSIIALGAAVGFTIGRANQLATFALPILINAQDILLVAQNHIGLFDAFIVALVLLLALAAFILSIEAKIPAVWTTNRWNVFVMLVLVTITGVWCNASNFNAVRADIAYNLAQVQNLDYAIGLDQSAIALAPLEDVYYRGLGITLAGKAQLADASNPVSRFDNHTPFSMAQQLTVPQIVALNRNDLFFAARATLLRARELNPLNPDHTVALAQMYSQWATLAPVATRPELVEQASQFYAQAISQRPRDARLLSESASFDVTFKNDSAAALQKLTESLRIDPRITQTYWKLGQTYSARNDFAKAIAMFEKYIALAPNAADVWLAHKNIATLYERTGDIAAALREAQLAADFAPENARTELLELVGRLRGKLAVP